MTSKPIVVVAVYLPQSMAENPGNIVLMVDGITQLLQALNGRNLSSYPVKLDLTGGAEGTTLEFSSPPMSKVAAA